ncbi:MAG: L-threonine 3-dehydrogenase [Fimbriimonadaceae bacterium]
MKAIAKVRSEPGVEIIDVQDSETASGMVKLRVRAASVCGTDLHIYNWDAWAASRVRTPRIIGHEFCGDVVEVGAGVTTHRVGDFVASESHIVCGRCKQCLNGQAHVCVNTQIIGVDVDGGFRPYAVVPASNAVHTDAAVPPRIAAFQDALGNAVHTAAAGPVKDQTLLITGMGPIGLFAASVCKALGAAKVIATEVSPYRIDLAHKIGVDLVLNPLHEDVRAVLRRQAPGGVDGVLEMSGHEASLDLAVEAVRPGGRISLLGVYASSPLPVDVDALIFQGVDVQGIVGRKLWGTWTLMQELLKAGDLVLDPVITHEMPYTEFRAAMELMNAGLAGKVVFTFQ